MNALVLEAPQFTWWNRFRSGLAHPVPEAAAVWERWTRARELGVPDEAIDPEAGLVRGGDLREHQERFAPFFTEVSEVFLQCAAATGDRDFKLLLADTAGVVVQARGGGGFAPVARELRLIEGASWSESIRGTNAIGTALAESRAAMVVGAAHYTRGFHDLVCYAAPIHDIEGNVIAVLDASSLVGRADRAVAALVATAALAMEATGKARAWARAGAQAAGLLERTLDRVADPALVIEAPGVVVRCNPAARQLLGARAAEANTERVLGVTWSVLRHAAISPGNARFPLPRFGVVVDGYARLEPLVAADGTFLAVAVFLDPAPTRRAATPKSESDPFSAVYAEDSATRAAVELGRRLAPSELPIVLLAETGSGKERFAEALHASSRRSRGPFVAVNCGSFAPELLAAELFGYAGGAFTGADRQGREGLLHAASGGTLFLDEVAEMPPPMQVALLRVLEDGRYERVGERVPRRADVRIIAATCRDLPSLVQAGSFRSDLWFRLKGVVIRLPPLRERTDRLGMAQFILRQISDPVPSLSPELQAFIQSHPWPGNVRELKSTLQVACVLAEGAPTLTCAHLPPGVEPERTVAEVDSGPADLDALQRHAMRKALDVCEGNVSAAARRLGVARSTIYRVLRRN